MTGATTDTRAAATRSVLAGFRVIDLTQNVAGPYCTQILADLGAEVVKIERPDGGEGSGGWGARPLGGRADHSFPVNRRKRSVCIDLQTEAGCALVADLAAEADIFVHSMKPGSADRRGLGEAALTARNPRLIHCAISAYGIRGPLAPLPGYDPIVQAFTGLMDLNGNPGDAPSRVPASVIDLGTGMWAALGIVGLCLQRGRDGVGGSVQASLLATGMAWMSPFVTEYTRTGVRPKRAGTRLSNAAPYELFEAADGQLFVAAPNDRLFGHVCAVLGCAGLARDPRFLHNADRLRHRDELHLLLGQQIGRRPVGELLRALRAAGVPCGELNRLDQVLAHPQVQANELLTEVQDPDGMALQVVDLPLRLTRGDDGAVGGHASGGRPSDDMPDRGAPANAAPLPAPLPAPLAATLPRLGQHTEEVLRGAGLADDRIGALRAQGVIR